ncbi:RING/U-box superfamily protein isoform 2 [Hibiscus syriacus]|uniref:RING/U-box superfamily protein isoform 2 n=1 Tax=Hibiscus syriacus TaxID=106335 RepID=A0A6A2Z1Y5_HIBSY|nr:RING/U-box superfamily protein isoform 2 [Hibiscus syriacus]
MVLGPSSSRLLKATSDFVQQGNSMWLNKGSKICIRWATQAKLVHASVRETRQETLVPKRTFPIDSLFLNEQVTGKEAELTVDEDDKYFVGAINSNPRSIIIAFTINVISKVYDVTKARSMCSTLNGPCRIDLQFPNTQYVVVSTTDNGDVNGWYIEVSCVVQLVSYIAVLGFFITIILLVLKSLGA